MLKNINQVLLKSGIDKEILLIGLKRNLKKTNFQKNHLNFFDFFFSSPKTPIILSFVSSNVSIK